MWNLYTHLERERERDLGAKLLLFGRDLERERLRDEWRDLGPRHFNEYTTKYTIYNLHSLTKKTRQNFMN